MTDNITGMKDGANKSIFLTRGSLQGNYLAYPRFLIGMDLNETAKVVYILLLDRCRLSAKEGRYVDENGYAYVFYDNRSLADHSGKSVTTVKDALYDLEKADLILRTNHEVGKPRRIYVKTKPENRPPCSRKTGYPPAEKPATPQPENRLPPGRKTGYPPAEIPAPYIYSINKTNINKTNISSNYSFREGESL